MKNILVVGNGYDIAHGLKTSYKDFIEFVLESKWESCSVDSLVEDSKGIEREFIKLVTDNPFMKYFKSYYRNISTWVDFESELRKITKAIYKYLRSIPEECNGQIPKSASYEPKPYVKKILEYFSYLQQLNFGTTYEDNLLLEPRIYNEVYGVNWDIVNDDMKKSLDDLKRALVIYLKYYMPCVSNTIDKNKQIEKIKPDLIISFNYTNTYQLYGFQKSQVLHVHGELESENIVLGYEDDEADKELFLLGFRKFFQRIENQLPMINKGLFAWNDQWGTHYSCMVHLYGMSLDKTDEDMIKTIFEGCRKFIVYYLDNGTDYPNKIKNLISVLGKKIFLDAYYDEKIVFIKIEKELYRVIPIKKGFPREK